MSALTMTTSNLYRLLMALRTAQHQGVQALWSPEVAANIQAYVNALNYGVYRIAPDGSVTCLYASSNSADLGQDGLVEVKPLDEAPFAWNTLETASGVKAFIYWTPPTEGKLVLVLTIPSDQIPPEERFTILGALLMLWSENVWLNESKSREIYQNEVLFRVSQAFMATTNLDALLEMIVSIVVEAVEQAENCVLHLLDPESNLLVARSVAPLKSKKLSEEGQPLRPGVGAAGLALSTGQIINIGDVTRDPRFLPRPSSSAIASLLTAPLMVRGQGIGTLSVQSSTPFAFGEDEERLLMTLATLAASAIDNAHLVQSLQQSLQALKDTQAQLVQSEKLSALGQLIAGITHEINNPLAAISGYAQILQMSEDISPQVRQDVTRIYEQAQRAARIVRNLLTFAREHHAMQRAIEVNGVIRRTLELLAYQLRVEGVSVNLQLANDPLYVMGDPYQLQQVFFNLITNARDAMLDQGGGRLTIRTMRQGDMVHIEIADTGPGLSPEVRQHLFEPFFTTKEVGKGTGLGLSICYGIITQHNGRIYAAETHEPGATFIIELPYTTNVPEYIEEKEEELTTYVTNRLVLVVEDEDPIARVIQRVLNREGHRVIVSHDGVEALGFLQQAKRRHTPFDLIISDIRMPNMDGKELYEHIRQDFPEMVEHILFITGDSISPSTRAFLAENNLPFIIKPFSIPELQQAITEHLG